MSGCKGQGQGSGHGGGRGRKSSGRGGRSNVFATPQSGQSKISKTGLCKELYGHIFDFGSKTAADQMRTLQVKIAPYVGSKYGEDIANKLENRCRLVIPGATYLQNILDWHTEQERLVRIQKNTILNANRNKLRLVELELSNDPKIVSQNIPGRV